MEEKLKMLSSITAPVCVTLVVRTHKSHPENQQDSILLKNSISEANRRLQNEFGKDIADRYTAKLEELARSIDHNQNDLGLLLFVNDDVAEYLRLPTRVNSRVIIDETFATRPIVRALKKDTDYLLLVLSRGKARLIEASSDKVLEEIETNDFPITESSLLTNLTKGDPSTSSKITSITQEFFNRVDKQVNEVRNVKQLPVVVYSDETNYHTYHSQADYPNTILGHIIMKNSDESASNLAKEVWPTIADLIVAKNRARITELENALSSGKFLSDLNEIWKAVQDGRGRTIFVEEGYFQAVKDEGGVLTPIKTEDISTKEDIDDIVDEMIEHNLKFGGDVVFLEKGSLEKFQKVALVTRY